VGHSDIHTAAAASLLSCVLLVRAREGGRAKTKRELPTAGTCHEDETPWAEQNAQASIAQSELMCEEMRGKKKQAGQLAEEKGTELLREERGDLAKRDLENARRLLVPSLVFRSLRVFRATRS
jgi:hypothetical protein